MIQVFSTYFHISSSLVKVSACLEALGRIPAISTETYVTHNRVPSVSYSLTSGPDGNPVVCLPHSE